MELYVLKEGLNEAKVEITKLGNSLRLGQNKF